MRALFSAPPIFAMTSDYILNLLIDLVAKEFPNLRLDLKRHFIDGKIRSKAKKIVDDHGEDKVCAIVYLKDKDEHACLVMHHMEASSFSLKHFFSGGYQSYQATNLVNGNWKVISRPA